MARQANILSWNIRCLNHIVKRKKVLTHLKQLKADIVFLQETHFLSNILHFFLDGWGSAFTLPSRPSRNMFYSFLKLTILQTYPRSVWAALKAYMRGQIISFTANMKRKSQKEQ